MINPLASLLDHLQKLVNEHASAAVLKEHLAMLRDHIALQDKRMKEIEDENTVLKEKLKKYESAGGRACPACGAAAFTLESSRPHELAAAVGIDTYRFSCSSCGFADEVAARSAGSAWKQALHG